MKQPKRGRPRKDAIERANRDFLIITMNADLRRKTGTRDYDLDIVIKSLYRLCKERIKPRAAIRQVASLLGLTESRIRRGVDRKFNDAVEARNKTARAVGVSRTEVARVLAAQERDTGELIPDD